MIIIKKINEIFQSFLFLLYCLTTNVLSFEILQKYSKVSTYEDYVIFNSTGFSENQEIYLQFQAKDICDDYLYYEYYDDKDLIYYVTPKYSTKQEFQETTRVNGVVKKYVMFFTIKKVNNELDGLKGNYMLLNFGCNGEVEIKNSKKNEKYRSLTVVLICLGVFLFVIIVIVIVCCYCRKMKRAARLQNIYQENQYYSGQPVCPQYVNNPFIYQTPNQVQNPNMNMMEYSSPSPNDMPYMNAPKNVKIVQKGAASKNQQAEPSSNREIISKKFQKPKPIS